jgi:hypothetical protein
MAEQTWSFVQSSEDTILKDYTIYHEDREVALICDFHDIYPRLIVATMNDNQGIGTKAHEAGAVAGLVEAAKAMRDYHLHDLTDYQDDPLPKLERALAVIDLDEALAPFDTD